MRTSRKLCERARFLDLDGDGDVDVLTWENRLLHAVLWYEHPRRRCAAPAGPLVPGACGAGRADVRLTRDGRQTDREQGPSHRGNNRAVSRSQQGGELHVALSRKNDSPGARQQPQAC